MITYEQQLDQNLRWAFQEGSMHFEKASAVHKALEKITRRLDELGIPYAVAGGMALFFHGYRRFTEDIDLVFTVEGLKKFHEQLIGLGYASAFPGARKRLRSTRDGVRIDVIASGEYPGDGKPKPVRFPNPLEASVEIDGVRFATLEKLIELKLASGMTAPDRLKDLADVQELIKIRGLSRPFAEKLNPYVREKYLELLEAVQKGSSNHFEEQL